MLTGAALLVSCASPGLNTAQRIDALLPADVILLGEQHDAPQHQRIERDVVQTLADRGTLAAVAVEMAEQGNSTGRLARDATDAQVQIALHWRSAGWPWTAYGPVVMAAVRAGVPVLGANLPRSKMSAAMAEQRLDRQLSGPALKAQQQAIRIGHCGLLPEDQISPMTRIQLARDMTMAQTVASAHQDGKTVLLIAGAGHVRRGLGVPLYLPPDLKTKVLIAQAGERQSAINSEADAVWETAALPPKDHCAELQRSMPPQLPQAQ
ncbi:MAG: ChaN family lipoprotein [Rhodoferax sp.]